MKKYKLKQSVKQKIKEYTELSIIAIGAATFLFSGLSLMNWRFQQLDEKYIQEEMQKKTEMSVQQISQ